MVAIICGTGHDTNYFGQCYKNLWLLNTWPSPVIVVVVATHLYYLSFVCSPGGQYIYITYEYIQNGPNSPRPIGYKARTRLKYILPFLGFYTQTVLCQFVDQWFFEKYVIGHSPDLAVWCFIDTIRISYKSLVGQITFFFFIRWYPYYSTSR